MDPKFMELEAESEISSRLGTITTLLNRLTCIPRHNSPASEARGLAELAFLLVTDASTKVVCTRIGTHGVLVVKTDTTRAGDSNLPLGIQVKPISTPLDRKLNSIAAYDSSASDLVYNSWALPWEGHIELVSILFNRHLLATVLRRDSDEIRKSKSLLSTYLIASSVAANKQRLRVQCSFFIRTLFNPAVKEQLHFLKAFESFPQTDDGINLEAPLRITDFFNKKDHRVLYDKGQSFVEHNFGHGKSLRNFEFRFFALLHDAFKSKSKTIDFEFARFLVANFFGFVCYVIQRVDSLFELLASFPRGEKPQQGRGIFKARIKELRAAFWLMDYFLFHSKLLEWVITVVLREPIERHCQMNVWSVWNWLVQSFSTIDFTSSVLNELLTQPRGNLELTVVEMTGSIPVASLDYMLEDLRLEYEGAGDPRALFVQNQILNLHDTFKERGVLRNLDTKSAWKLEPFLFGDDREAAIFTEAERLELKAANNGSRELRSVPRVLHTPTTTPPLPMRFQKTLAMIYEHHLLLWIMNDRELLMSREKAPFQIVEGTEEYRQLKKGLKRRKGSRRRNAYELLLARAKHISKRINWEARERGDL